MRCFIAIPCPKEVREDLVKVQESIKSYGNLKLVSKDNIHLTLKFLGEVDENRIQELKDNLSFINDESKFNVKVKGLGVFPNLKRISVVWAGLEDGARVNEIQSKIDKALESKGFKLDNRFHPHYTIARVKSVSEKDKLIQVIKENKETSYGGYTIDRVDLMESKLLPTGPEYSILESYTIK